MNKYDAKLAKMDAETARKFSEHLNAGFNNKDKAGAKKSPAKKTVKRGK